MKKRLFFAMALSMFFLTACNNQDNLTETTTIETTTKTNKETTTTTTKTTNYQVTEEEYNEVCYYSSNVARITSLNYTVTNTETVNDNTYQYITKVDYGKVMTIASYGDFYCDFKEGTYNSDNRTWSFDGYFEDDGVMEKIFFENQEMPDDIYLPSAGFIVSYEEVQFNSETNCYEQIAESKTLNEHEIYSDVKIQFINGNVSYISYTYMNSTNPEKVYSCVMEITNYGTTVVSLPTIE